MIVLGILGVDRSSLLDDYALSNKTWTARWLDHFRRISLAQGFDFERVRLLFEAPIEAAEIFIDHVEDRFGSFEGLARRRFGFNTDRLESLRSGILFETC